MLSKNFENGLSNITKVGEMESKCTKFCSKIKPVTYMLHFETRSNIETSTLEDMYYNGGRV